MPRDLSVRAGNRKTTKSDLGVIDLPYFFLTLLLVAVGLIVLLSASYARAYHVTGNSASYFTSQLVFALMGVAAMLFVSRVPYDWYRKFYRVIFAVTVLLLAAVLLVGTNVNGATRWINLGFTQFQPSEIAKFSLIVTLSVIMSRCRDEIKSLRVFFLCAGSLVLIAVLLILEPHFSATIIIASLCFCMMAVGGVNWKYLGLVMAVGGAGLLLLLLTGGYTSERITAWLDPESDPLDSGLQILQSEYAIGSGGLLGLGLGKGRQKFLYLPEEHNDFIFAVVCEELGLVGAAIIMLIFAMLLLRGFWIALHARDRFGTLLVVGIMSHLGLQVFLNIAVVSGLVPATGISLPFFSYGGTALVLQLVEMGIVLSVSRQIPAPRNG